MVASLSIFRPAVSKLPQIPFPTKETGANFNSQVNDYYNDDATSPIPAASCV